MLCSMSNNFIIIRKVLPGYIFCLKTVEDLVIAGFVIRLNHVKGSTCFYNDQEMLIVVVCTGLKTSHVYVK